MAVSRVINYGQNPAGLGDTDTRRVGPRAEAFQSFRNSENFPNTARRTRWLSLSGKRCLESYDIRPAAPLDGADSDRRTVSTHTTDRSTRRGPCHLKVILIGPKQVLLMLPEELPRSLESTECNSLTARAAEKELCDRVVPHEAEPRALLPGKGKLDGEFSRSRGNYGSLRRPFFQRALAERIRSNFPDK